MDNTGNQAGDALTAPLESYLNVTTALTTFSVDYNTPENLLNALETIERNEKMVLVSNLQVGVSQAAMNIENVTNRPAAGSSGMEYKCVAAIKFVNLAVPNKESPILPDEAPDASDSQAAPFEAKPTPSDGTAADPNLIFEVPVDTVQD